MTDEQAKAMGQRDKLRPWQRFLIAQLDLGVANQADLLSCVSRTIARYTVDPQHVMYFLKLLSEKARKQHEENEVKDA